MIHKGLRRLIQNDDPAGLQPVTVRKLKHMVSYLQDMEHEDELYAVTGWKAHQLSGDRKGVWSLSVTKNWRLTFRIDHEEIEIIDLNYENYH